MEGEYIFMLYIAITLIELFIYTYDLSSYVIY